MIRHVAVFTWAESVADEDIASFAGQLATMPANVPGILRYDHGDDLQLGPGTADYVLVADFETVEDYRLYSKHPYHVAFIESQVKPIAAGVARVQYHLADGDSE